MKKINILQNQKKLKKNNNLLKKKKSKMHKTEQEAQQATCLQLGIC